MVFTLSNEGQIRVRCGIGAVSQSETRLKPPPRYIIIAENASVSTVSGLFEPADTSRKGLKGREEVLEKSNTWPEQVLETLHSCWRALLEMLFQHTV